MLCVVGKIYARILADRVHKVTGGLTIKSINSSAYVRVKRDESERFKIDSGVRQDCIISPWPFNVYFDAMLKKGKMGMERM